MPVLFWIILLIVVGILLFVAELVLLPGVTFAAILSFCSMCAAAAWIFSEYGILYGFIGLGGILLLMGVLTAIYFRRSTWRRVTLDTELAHSLDTPVDELCTLGAIGTSITRLAPMGKVIIDGTIFEAKTMGGFVDEQREVTVIGFENHNIIVELKK